MAAEGAFRADLLYRLQGLTIVIPPLRERRDEIPALARQAISRFCLKNDQPGKSLSDAVLDILLEYPWPGNVRQLIHCLERACLAAGGGDLLLPAHLPTRMRATASPRGSQWVRISASGIRHKMSSSGPSSRSRRP